MTVSCHMEEAAAKLQEAARQIALAREGLNSCENQRVWLEGLTAYFARPWPISIPNIIENESVHEKLHELAGWMGLRKFPSSP